MTWLFRLFVSFLVWLSADSEQLAREPARAAAAVAAAKSAMVGAARVRDSVEGVEAQPTIASGTNEVNQ